MNISITARHCELTDEEKSFIEERAQGLSKFHNRIMEAHITIIEEKPRQRAEIKVSLDHSIFFGEAESMDLRQSVEQVVQKMQRQITKHKGRFQRRTATKEELAAMSRESEAPDDKEEVWIATSEDSE